MCFQYFPEGIILSYCSAKRIPIIGYPRWQGLMYFYYFDEDKAQFFPLSCLECQPEIVEEALFPVLFECGDEIENHMIHVDNKITLQMERYRFCRDTGGFIQIFLPKLQSKPGVNPTYALKFPKSEHSEEIIIQRGFDGSIEKTRYSEEVRHHVQINPVLVKTLLMQDLEKSTQKPSRPNALEYYNIHVCPHYSSINVTGTPGVNFIGFNYKGKPLRFRFDQITRQFESFFCPICFGPVTENHLKAMYSVRHPSTGIYVIFAFNVTSYNMEQYIFNPQSTGFEQVDYKELKFDPNRLPLPQILYSQRKAQEEHEVTVILRSVDGVMIKQRSDSSGSFRTLPAIPVKTLCSENRQQKLLIHPCQESTKEIGTSKIELDGREDSPVPTKENSTQTDFPEDGHQKKEDLSVNLISTSDRSVQTQISQRNIDTAVQVLLERDNSSQDTPFESRTPLQQYLLLFSTSSKNKIFRKLHH